MASADEGAQDGLTFRGDLVEVRAERSFARGGRFFSVPGVWGILRLIGPCEEESGSALRLLGTPRGSPHHPTRDRGASVLQRPRATRGHSRRHSMVTSIMGKEP